MGTHDPVAAARRRAKAMSRDGSISHQKALDLIGRENGHAHWAAFQKAHASEAVPEVVPVVRDAVQQSGPGWRVMQMDRMLGSRHSPSDEWCIRRIGGPIAMASERMGPNGLLLMITLVHLAAMASNWAISGDPVLMLYSFLSYCIVPISIATNLADPDGKGRRQGRRSILSFMAMWTLVFVGVLACRLTIPWPAMPDGPSMTLMILSMYPTIIAFNASQYAAAWLGRKRRRDH
jgi:hypothetical protein